MQPLRNHESYLAFLGHRLSGLALAIFLPFHFLALGLALEGAETLDGFLVFADLPLVKVAEWGLVTLLTLHLCFGVRVLALEFTRWPFRADPRLNWIFPGILAATAVGVAFYAQVV